MSNLQPNTSQTTTGVATDKPGSGGGDMLDKGVDFLASRAGQKQSRGMTEKISDGIRKVIQKITGKDIPIADKDYSQGK